MAKKKTDGRKVMTDKEKKIAERKRIADARAFRMEKPEEYAKAVKKFNEKAAEKAMEPGLRKQAMLEAKEDKKKD